MRYPFPVGKSDFIQGDEAIARAAILAGCRFYAGYPITPASEIFEAMALYMPPLVDGVSIQMEDELASMAAIIGGASWAGAKVMTATSGPGFSLMQENLGYAVMTETPVVVVDVQRGGPRRASRRWRPRGGHNAGHLGGNPRRSFAHRPQPVDRSGGLRLNDKAFNLAEKYRTPVVLLTDAEIAHMRERVYIPSPDEIEIVNRKLPANEEEAKLPFGGDPHGDGVPPMPIFGKGGYHTYVTGLTHDEMGHPKTVDAEVHERLIRRIFDKLERNRDEIISYEEFELDDAEVAIVSTGIVSRSAIRAVKMLRERGGVKAGMLKLNTIWPFNFEMIEELAERVRKIYVPEMNMGGQLYHLVREGANGRAEVELIAKIGGGEVHTPDGHSREGGGMMYLKSAYEIRDKYLRKDMLPTIFCPGCGIGSALQYTLRAIDDLGLNQDEIVWVSGIGCSSRVPGFVDFDGLHTTHGRALAFATGIKLANPDLKIIAFMGDGDTAAIGGNHFIHAIRRNLDVTVILINNFTYGMTGGQVAPPTTLKGLKGPPPPRTDSSRTPST